MPDADSIGRRIASRRAWERWTQAELGERVGVRQPTVARWEAGDVLPTVPQLVQLAQTFGVTEAWLIHGTVTPAEPPAPAAALA